MMYVVTLHLQRYCVLGLQLPGMSGQARLWTARFAQRSLTCKRGLDAVREAVLYVDAELVPPENRSVFLSSSTTLAKIHGHQPKSAVVAGPAARSLSAPSPVSIEADTVDGSCSRNLGAKVLRSLRRGAASTKLARVSTVALADRTARIAWVTMVRGDIYRVLVRLAAAA